MTTHRDPADAATLPAPPPGNPRFELFDGLRALAALSVLLYHVGAIGGGNADGALRYVGRCLAVGVPIFFAISGFLLYRPLVSARLAGRPRPSVRAYARRRILRIVPAYWVALTVLAIAFSWQGVFGADSWRYYGFAQIYDERTFDGGLAVGWTLCIEITFYLLLPFFALAMARFCPPSDGARAVRREVAILLGLAALSGLFRAIVGERSGYEYPAAMLPGTFLWFVPGMLLAVWSAAEAHVPGATRRALLAPGSGTAAWAVALLAFATVCVLGAVDAPRYLADDLVVPVLTLCLLAPAVAGRPATRSARTLPQAILGTRPLLALGVVSYGIYLYHATLIAWLDAHDAGRLVPGSHWLGLAVASIVAGSVAGAVSWFAVERPALTLKSGSVRRRRARPAASAPLPVADPAPAPAPAAAVAD